MPFKKNIFFNTSRITVLMAIAAITISMIVLIGWLYQSRILTSFHNEWVSMKVNTALGALSAAGSVLFFTSGRKRLSALLALFTLLLGAITIAEYSFNWNAGIDELFFGDHAARKYPGRMSQIIAISFILSGIALLCLQNKKYRILTDTLSILVLAAGFLGFTGYLYNARHFYSVANFNSVSFPGTLTLICISSAILFSQPEQGLMNAFNEKTKAAKVGTLQIFFLITLLLILGWFCMEGYEAGYYDMQFGLGAMLVVFIVIFLLTLVAGIRKLNRSDAESYQHYKMKEKSENDLRQIMDNSTGMIASIDREHRIIAFNKAVENEYKLFSGMDLKPGVIHYHVFPPEGREEWRTKINEALGGNSVKFERTYGIGGQKKYVEAFIYPIRKGQEIEGVTCFVTDITNRKLAELEKDESQQKYHSLFDNSADGILLTIPDGSVLAANKAACEIFGMTEDEICKAGRAGIVDIADPNLPVLLQERRSTGRASGELTFIRKNGTKFPGEITSVIFKDASGNERSSMIIRDITKRKEAEKQLKISEARLKKAQQIGHIGNWYYNFRDNKIQWSDETYQVYGVSPESFIPGTQSIIQLIHPEDRKAMEENIQSFFAGINPGEVEVRVMLADGSIRYVIGRGDLKFDKDGKPISITGTVQDVTSLKKAELLLREKETRLRTIFNTEPECIKLLNEKGELLDMNPAGLAMIEADNLEMVKGKQVLGVVMAPHRGAFADLTKKVFAGGSGILQFEITGLKGTHRWLETHAVPMKDAEGKVTTLLSVTRDITERKKTQEEKERLLGVLQSSLNEIYIFDAGSLKFEYLNDAALRNIGYSMEAMSEMTPVDIKPEFTPATFQKLITPLAQQEKEKIVFETIHQRADGSTYPVEVHLQLIVRPDQSVFLAVILDITERKEASEKLHNTHTQLSFHVENAPLGYIEWDNKLFVRSWSKKAEEIFGWSENEFIANQKNGFSLVYEEDVPQLRIVAQQLMNGEVGRNHVINRNCTKDGRVIWCEWFNSVLKDNGGQVITIMSLVQDITKRKQAEEKLQQSEMKLKTLVENIHESLLIEDREGNLQYANGEFSKIFGYTEEEFKTLSLRDYTAPQSLEEVLERHNKRMQGLPVPDTFEYKALRKDGKEIWIDCRVTVLTENGKITGTQSLERDVTDRKLAEERLKESEQKYRGLMQQAGDFIVIFDNSGKIAEANQSAEQMLGYDTREYKNMFLKDFFFAEDLKENPLQLDLLNKGQSTISTRRVKKKDGGFIVIEIHSRKLSDGYYIGVGRDLTERLKAEQQIRESEQKYRSIVERNLAGIYQTTPAGKIITCNTAFARMMGYAPEFLMKQDAGILYFTEEDRTNFIRILKKNGEVINREIKLKHKDGNPVFLIENCFLQTNPESGQPMIEGVVIDITKRKQAEEDLRLSEGRYRSLIEQASDGILLSDLQGNILEINPALCTMFGYKKAEALEKSIYFFLEPNDLSLKPMRFNQIQKGHHVLVERKAIHKNGDIFDIELSSKQIEGDKILSTIRNVSERKKAEEALRRSETRYRTIIDTTDEMMHRLSTEGKIEWVNESWKINMGFADKEVIGKKLTDFINNDTKLEFGKVFPQLMNGKKVKNLSCGFITKKGEVIFLEGQALPVINNGKVTGSQSFLRNVTERKKAEAQIREGENRFRSLVDSAPDATVIANEKGIIQIANLQAAKLFGYSKTELTGMPVELLIPAKDRDKHKDYRNQFVNVSKTRLMGSGRDLVAVNKAGVEIPVEISLSPFHSSEGVLVTASIRDITSRKKAEKELEESYRAVRQLSEHLQNVREEERTHIAREVHDELGQQLTVMMMDVSWLGRKTDPENKAAVKKLNELLVLMENMVKTVRRISTELRPSVLDDLGLGAAIEMHLKEFKKRTGINTRVMLPNEEPEMNAAVKSGLFRIVQESLTNVVRHAQASEVMIKLEKKGKKICLLINDNGIGFDEKKTAGKRTLGVLGMKERAAAFGGEFYISGNPGKGTNIRVSVSVS